MTTPAKNTHERGMTMTAHDVLVRTKGYLLNHGWKQYGYGRDGGPRCMVGAMASVSGLTAPSRTRWRPPAMRRAMRVLEQEFGEATSFFNDDWDRTLEDVVGALDRAIFATAPAEMREAVGVAVREGEASHD